ncbi:MAG: penicillin-binding protein 2 [Gemmatimonadales bacterium]
MSTAFSTFRVRERVVVTTWVLAGVFLVIATAFFRAQILGNEDFRRMSDNNRLRRLTLTAPRGLILDRHNQPIAENAPGFTVRILAPSEDSLKAMIRRIGTVVPVSADLETQVIRRYQLAKYQPALLFSNASIETVAALEERRYQLPGLVIRTEPRRLYASESAVGHIVGYVSEVSAEDLESRRYRGAKPGTLVGKGGLEARYDSIVRGLEGEGVVEINARGRLVRDETDSPTFKPIPGEQIKTTIDLGLQVYVDSLWRAERPTTKGALVAMQPDGQVLAIYSAPSFDPNSFIQGLSTAEWAALRDPEEKPLFNRAVNGFFPPGSPFKLVTAAVALRRGLVTFSTRMPQPCTGGYRLGNRVFHCWNRSGHGSLDLTGAIANSCNVYFYQLGLRIGLQNFLSDVTDMGLGDPTGIDLSPEQSSTFPANVAYYDRTYGPRGWSPPAASLNLAIGQGENAQTLISMTRFYAALAGDGPIPVPYLYQPPTGVKPRSLGLTAEQLAGLRDAMGKVVSEGTARSSQGRDLNVAGKTGTAQNSQGPDHGWFIAFAPADHPRIVVGSIMENALHGTAVAPFVVKVIRRYLTGGDPLTEKEPIKVIGPADSATTATELPPDTLVTGRR